MNFYQKKNKMMPLGINRHGTQNQIFSPVYILTKFFLEPKRRASKEPIDIKISPIRSRGHSHFGPYLKHHLPTLRYENFFDKSL